MTIARLPVKKFMKRTVNPGISNVMMMQEDLSCLLAPFSFQSDFHISELFPEILKLYFNQKDN